MNDSDIELGDEVKDVISGFHGIAVARSQFLQGCDRVGIQPRELHEGKPIEVWWFDVPYVKVVKKAVMPYTPVVTGGPRPAPKARGDAR